MASTSDQSLYDRLGGSEAIDAAVDAFHDRVGQDDWVNHYFQDVDMETLLQHQKAFFEVGTGGPGEYPGREIAASHAPLGIDDQEFDIFVGHLEETLSAFGVPDPERQELLEILEEYRPSVVFE